MLWTYRSEPMGLRYNLQPIQRRYIIFLLVFVNDFECKINPFHMQVVGVDFNPYFLSKDEDGCVKLSMKEYTNNLTSIKTRVDIFSGDEISIREVSFVATLTKVILLVHLFNPHGKVQTQSLPSLNSLFTH